MIGAQLRHRNRASSEDEGMRISDATPMAGLGGERRRGELGEREAASAAEAPGGAIGEAFDSMGLSTLGFAGMLSELALGEGALLPSGSRVAATRAFFEWSDAAPDDSAAIAA